MAFNAMFVDDGANLTPAAAKVIAIGPSAGDYTYLLKTQIRNISVVYIPFVKASQANNGYPFMDSCSVYIELNSGASMTFDCQACINQNGWVTSAVRAGGTAASPEAGLRQAEQDIISWL